VTLLSKKNISIIEGPVLSNMIKYSLPIMFANVLQLFYSSADMMILSNFCSDPNARGSVGCTGALINLIFGVFIGLGAGVSVTLAQSIGAGDKEKSSKVVHTAFCLAVVLGAFVTVFGILMTEPLLKLNNTLPDFFDGASLYVKIFFCGSIANMIYNFFSGILRSRGDTVRPLMFSMVGGVVNVFLNFIFVKFFGMGVEGVAIATIISQFISAVLVIRHMCKLDDECRLDFKKLAFDASSLKQLIKIGLPAGVQGSLFSFSNMVLQWGYNSLGVAAIVNANSAAMYIDGYIYNILNSFYHTCLTFCSQNFGAKRFDRVKKVCYWGVALATVIGLFMGVAVVVFAKPLLSVFKVTDEEFGYATTRLIIIGLPYFLCGIMEVGSALLRSIGHSFKALIVTFIGSCLLRVAWVFTIFASFADIKILYLSYPISWFVTALTLLIMFFFSYKKEKKMIINELK
jgi:putative MATE family efflux protein